MIGDLVIIMITLMNVIVIISSSSTISTLINAHVHSYCRSRFSKCRSENFDSKVNMFSSVSFFLKVGARAPSSPLLHISTTCVSIVMVHMYQLGQWLKIHVQNLYQGTTLDVNVSKCERYAILNKASLLELPSSFFQDLHIPGSILP